MQSLTGLLSLQEVVGQVLHHHHCHHHPPLQELEAAAAPKQSHPEEEAVARSALTRRSLQMLRKQYTMITFLAKVCKNILELSFHCQVPILVHHVRVATLHTQLRGLKLSSLTQPFTTSLIPPPTPTQATRETLSMWITSQLLVQR